MRKRLKTVLLFASLLMAADAVAQPADPVSVRPLFVQGSMNVFRRFPAEDRARMIDFYQKVLGLQPLAPIQLNPNLQMILFRVGRSGQIKLSTGLAESRKYHLGGINEATGIRLYTLHFADEAALAARFATAGYPAPAFKDIGGGRRAAMVKDPGGFNLELVIAADARATTAGVEVGINVSDLARSRAFYHEFAGLDELPPVEDPVLGVTKYPFRHGETTISLWSAGKDLPADTGSAGIQYVVGNVAAVNDKARAENVTVETPLGGVPGFNVVTVWLNDPDGVTNYFYQMGPRDAATR